MGKRSGESRLIIPSVSRRSRQKQRRPLHNHGPAGPIPLENRKEVEINVRQYLKGANAGEEDRGHNV